MKKEKKDRERNRIPKMGRKGTQRKRKAKPHKEKASLRKLVTQRRAKSKGVGTEVGTNRVRGGKKKRGKNGAKVLRKGGKAVSLNRPGDFRQ